MMKLIYLPIIVGLFLSANQLSAQTSYTHKFSYNTNTSSVVVTDEKSKADVTNLWTIVATPESVIGGSGYPVTISSSYSEVTLTLKDVKGVSAITFKGSTQFETAKSGLSISVDSTTVCTGHEIGLHSSLPGSNEFTFAKTDGDIILTLRNQTPGGGDLYINTVTITAEGIAGGTADAQLTAPKILLDGKVLTGEVELRKPVDLTITADEGASIYYTTNGTDPTGEGASVYTAPVHIGYGSTTLRAISLLNGEYSEESSVSFSIGTSYDYVPISLTDIQAGEPFIIASDLQRTLVSGNLSGESITTTSSEDSYGFFRASPSSKSGYYYITDSKGTKIGVTKKSAADLSSSNNRDWRFEPVDEENGQYKILNYVGSSGAERYLAFDSGIKYYTSSYVYGAVPYLLKRVLTAYNEFSISESGYATLYVDHAFIMPEGATGGYITESIESVNAGDAPTYKLVYNWAYEPGDTVPQLTPIVLRADKAGVAKTYEYSIVESDTSAPTQNLLHGTLQAESTALEGDYYYYKLAYKSQEEPVLGFWWGAEDGGPFENAGGKAYLALSKANNYKTINGFGFDSSVSAIGGVTVDAGVATPVVYTLTGQRVVTSDVRSLPAGLYIVDGKKVLIK